MDEQLLEYIYFFVYGGVTVLSLVACCYLLFSRGNAFDPDITPPAPRRRWAAAFFAAITLSQLWYLPFYFLSSSEDVILGHLIGGLLDCLTVFPLSIVVLLTMLQDRKRLLWPVWVMMTPLVPGLVWCIATRSDALLPIIIGYFLLICIGVIIYMVRATKQYGRWLRDNYADLEHKEVWQSFVVLAVILLGFLIYSFDFGELIYEYAMEVITIALICYFLWRVETLSDLSHPVNDAEEVLDNGSAVVVSSAKDIGSLLKRYCEEPQLYLQHDISITQLATLIGTNRSYLSKHFALQGINYNAYINGLRIRHFINLYHETAATHHPVCAKQLAYQSGFRSYNTFSVAFKKMMGMSTTEWIRNQISA